MYNRRKIMEMLLFLVFRFYSGVILTFGIPGGVEV